LPDFNQSLDLVLYNLQLMLMLLYMTAKFSSVELSAGLLSDLGQKKTQGKDVESYAPQQLAMLQTW